MKIRPPRENPRPAPDLNAWLLIETSQLSMFANMKKKNLNSKFWIIWNFRNDCVWNSNEIRYSRPPIEKTWQAKKSQLKTQTKKNNWLSKLVFVELIFFCDYKYLEVISENFYQIVSRNCDFVFSEANANFYWKLFLSNESQVFWSDIFHLINSIFIEKQFKRTIKMWNFSCNKNIKGNDFLSRFRKCIFLCKRKINQKQQLILKKDYNWKAGKICKFCLITFPPLCLEKSGLLETDTMTL